MSSFELLMKVRETQQATTNFLNSIMKQELKPNYRPKAPCSCPSFKLNRNPEEHNAPPTNTNNDTLTSLRMTPTFKRLK